MKKFNRSKIILSLRGGLGNQMFQYALYKWLLFKNFNVYMDKHYYDINKSVSHEKYKLNYFNIDETSFIKFSEASYYIDFPVIYNLNTILQLKINLFLLLKNIYFRIYLKISNKFHLKYKVSKTFHMEKPKSDLNFISTLNKDTNIYMYGTFTFNKYVEELRISLINIFTFKKSIPVIVKEKLKEMKMNNSVAIHIRRGDYIGDRVREVCSMSYYRNAIQYLTLRYNDLFFFIFTNDIEFVKTNFFFLPNYQIIDNYSLDTPDYYDLFLMTQVNHLIISNSTFSWWGAWLNQNSEKIVIVPERYHLDNSWVDSSELYPSEWIKLAIN